MGSRISASNEAGQQECDPTSTYFELDFADGELDDDTDNQSQDPFRLRGHSKDARPDLPQVVIGMAVTTGGLPVKLCGGPGDTQDQTVLTEIKQDLAGWRLSRTVWVVDAGFTSKDNRKVLSGGGSGFIIAEKLRGNEAATVEARTRQGRFRTVDESLQVKDIRVGEGLDAQRFVMIRNLDTAAHDAHVRDRLVALLEDRIDGSDALTPDKQAELRGRIREKPGLWRYLRTTPSGLLRVDRAKIAAEKRLDGKTLIRTSEIDLDAEQVARGYKALLEVEPRFPHFAESFRRDFGGGVVDAGGDVEEVEDLLLEVGEVGVEGAQHGAVWVGEFVAGDAGGDLEDAGGGWGGAAAVFGVERQLGQAGICHGLTDGSFDQR